MSDGKGPEEIETICVAVSYTVNSPTPMSDGGSITV